MNCKGILKLTVRRHSAVLRNSVTSPAGTTASAIYELENGKSSSYILYFPTSKLIQDILFWNGEIGKFRTVIKDAIWACYRRSLEMGGKSSQVGPNRYPIPMQGSIGGGSDESITAGNSNTQHGRSSHHPVEPPVGEMGVPSSFGSRRI